MSPSSALFLAASLPERPGLFEQLGYQLNGMIVVFLALASIWLLLEIIGRIFKLRAASPVAPTPGVPVAAAPAPAPQVAPGVPPELVAVIIAAVHVTCGQRARIASIVPVITNTWSRDGRRQIFSSHQLR